MWPSSSMNAFAFLALATSTGATESMRVRRMQDGNAGPTPAGDTFATRIDQSESSAVHPALSEEGSLLSYSIMFREGAPYTTVHFSEFDMGSSCKMIVSGKDLPDGRQQVYEMVGKGKMELGTFWTQHVKGDTMDLVIECPAGVQVNQETHFIIDIVAVGFLEDGTTDTETICGTNDLENAICYSGTTQYTKARAVARLLINGAGYCTGWLVSSNNHLVTNNHCISSQTTASNTDFEFVAEAATCGTSNCQGCHAGTVFSGSTFLKTSSALDYGVVQLSASVASTYGFLEIDDRTAAVREQIYIAQHPGGRAKEFGIKSTYSADTSGVCRVQSVSSSSVKYSCDTEGGSSGSPVFASSSNRVIALHFAGSTDCVNFGKPINAVWAEIKSIVSTPSPTSAPGPCFNNEPLSKTQPTESGLCSFVRSWVGEVWFCPAK